MVSDSVSKRKLMLADPWYQLILRMMKLNLHVDFHSKNILEVGCGRGGFCMEMAKKCTNVIGLDVSRTSLRKGKYLAKKSGFYERINFILGDAQFLPFREKSFFITVCSETLEHIPHYNRAFQQVVKVTQKLGYLFVTIPNYLSTQLLEFWLWSIIGMGGHIHGLHIFHYLKVRRLFKREDLEILDLRGTNFLHIPFFSVTRMEWNAEAKSNEPSLLRLLRYFEKCDRSMKFFGSNIGVCARVRC